MGGLGSEEAYQVRAPIGMSVPPPALPGRSQLWGMLMKRYLCAKRDWKAVGIQLTGPVVFIWVTLLIIRLMQPGGDQKPFPIAFAPYRQGVVPFSRAKIVDQTWVAHLQHQMRPIRMQEVPSFGMEDVLLGELDTQPTPSAKTQVSHASHASLAHASVG